MNFLNKYGVIFSSTRIFGILLAILTLHDPYLFSQLPDKGTAILHEKKFCEELYVKTDRDLYIAGETVWLKIYKLNGLNHTPSNISKVAYSDLLDLENNPLIQLKTGIDGNSGSTSFRLPDTLRTGNYILRSYTNWMQNFSADLFSYKGITVVNPFENISNIKVPSRSQIPDSVIFSPEGGHLIAGIETRLGFRSMDKKGNPVIMKGSFIYENNDTICYAKTEINGSGWITLRPVAHTRIFLVTTNKEGSSKKFTLPDTQNEGITISVTKKVIDSSPLVKIISNLSNNPAGNRFYVILNSASLTNIKKEINPVSENEINILPEDLPEGFSHIRIVDNLDNQMTDRWIYNEIKPGITYHINPQKKIFSKREKIKIDITAVDKEGAPVKSDLSISVVKAVTINNSSFNNNKFRQLPCLATNTSDNYLPDINDYLLFYMSNEPNIFQDEIFNKNTPAYLPELEGHLVSGNIKDRKSGEPLKNENITLSLVGKVALCQFTKTNEHGDFYFLTSEHGLHEIVIQPLSPELKDCYVDFYNPFNTTFNNYNHTSFYLDSSRVGSINNVIIGMQVNNIYEPYRQQSVRKSGLSGKTNFYGKPDNTIEMSKYIELTSLKEVVKELMPGVTTYKSKGKTNFRLIKYQSLPFEKNPLVLVDGVPVYDLDKVLSINSKEVEKVDVLIAKYYISDNELDGILHFITKKGNLGAIDLDKSVFRQEYELLRDNYEFYSPDYSTDSLKNNRIPDFRNTLYWNSDTNTDEKGKATVEFYSSDESADYIITVEGITPDGKSGVASIPLIVKSR